MRIIRASALGMCFGVIDAIALARQKASATPLTVLGDLVHNETVLADLRRRGVRIENSPEAIATRAVMITAHGASQKTIQRVRDLGLAVSEATCPLVRYAHRAAAKLVAGGYYPVIIGQPGHVEVKGVIEDLEEYSVLLTPADLEGLPERPRYGVIAQTTQTVERVQHLVLAIQHRYPEAEVRYVDTICRPTKQRQAAAVRLALESDVVVVIGGNHSNNTRELVRTCGRYCQRVCHVQLAEDLRQEWFEPDDVVGITAGTSTPDEIIDAVEARLVAWANRLAAPTPFAEAHAETQAALVAH